MIFASDNWAGAHEKISESLTRHAAGYAAAYGNSDLDRQVEARFSEIFGCEVAVFFVATGTAANSLAIASVNKPGAVGFCHRESHVMEDECGAPGFLAPGARMWPVEGRHGLIDPASLKDQLARFRPGDINAGRATAISLTQANEYGKVYDVDRLDAIAAIAREHELALHMDGARFANALVSLDLSAAEMTWKRGVDIVSFGGTKNGCWCAEAVVFMNPEAAEEMKWLRKRAAHLFSKSRFVAAQFEAYLADDLWLQTARHANAMATRLAEGLKASSRTRLAWTPDANEIFAIIRKPDAERARGEGAAFYDWVVPAGMENPPEEDQQLVRLVTSFATREEDVDRFLDLVA